jgi:hypothetical protein
MLIRLVDRRIATLENRLVLLAPETAIVPPTFANIDADPDRHRHLLAEMQRLRGGVYLRDGAIATSDLTIDGLHRTPEDDNSWHLLMTDDKGRVEACVWYRDHDRNVTFDQLRVRRTPLAQQPGWREHLRRAVEQELCEARSNGLGYAELGGWAVASENQSLCSGLLLAVASYSLGRAFGGSLGMTTATVRHCSSTILRRLGGKSLAADATLVPSYFDQRYNCEMELLRFDSRRPTPKYVPIIDALQRKLREVTVITAAAAHTASVVRDFVSVQAWPRQPLQVAS